MAIGWKVLNNVFYKYNFSQNQIICSIQSIPMGIYDDNLNIDNRRSLSTKEFQNWNIDVYLKLYRRGNDVYFTEDSDYLVVNDLNCYGCGFLFYADFQKYLKTLVFTNNPMKDLFSSISGTYVFDNRIVIIDNPNFENIHKLSYYSKKLILSPFQLNSEKSPYHLLKNYICVTTPSILTKPDEIPIKGGLITYTSPGYHNTVYEYDIISFYPNIIMKFLDDDEPIKRLITPLIDDIKCLKLYLYGLAGNKNTNIYSPVVINLVTTIGRKIVERYKTRAIIIATDAIFMSTPIIPNFGGLSYKTSIHTDMFVINASVYFTRSVYRGLPKNELSNEVHVLLYRVLDHLMFDNTMHALLYFMNLLRTFPISPVPLKNGECVSYQIDFINPNVVNKYEYLRRYKKIIYEVCNYKSKVTLNYNQYKKMYDFFTY